MLIVIIKYIAAGLAKSISGRRLTIQAELQR